MRFSGSVVLAALILAGGAGGGRGRIGPPLGPVRYGSYDVTGIASWYGSEMAGGRTASGDRFDPGKMTAAHRALPLGSYAEVTALGTGRAVIVRINDRGPGRADRLIDLSRAAAQRLGTDRLSIARVRVRAVTPSAADIAALRHGRVIAEAAPGPVAPIAVTGPGPFGVQVASFGSMARAAALAEVLHGNVVPAGPLYRVYLGPYADAQAAQRARDDAAARGYGDAQLVHAP